MGNLKDRYCIVGIGETEYSRNSGRTTRAMAVEAIKKALDDAGLRSGDVDGMIAAGIKLLTNDALRVQMGKEGRRWVTTHFHVAHVVKRYEEFYHYVLEHT